MSFFENTRKPKGLGGKIMLAMMNSGHGAMAEWGFQFLDTYADSIGKVLGFRDKAIGKLLISQNIWLTVIGVLIGIPAGLGVLKVLVAVLVSEYELSLTLSPFTFVISIALTFGVSLLVGLMVSGRSKKIDMVEALKGAE